MKKTKAQKGITLIALIITIVVLLILAVVAIRAVQGDGIIIHAKKASEESKYSSLEEKIRLSMSNNKIDEELGNGKNLKDVLSEVDGVSNVEEVGHNNLYKITSSNGEILYVYSNGTILRDSVSVWDGQTIEQPTVKEDGVYINTAAQLKGLETMITNGEITSESKVFLTQNIDLGGVVDGQVVEANNWTPISTFAGIFDGQGHIISGMYCKDGQVLGLFKVIDTGATVKNLTLTNSYIESTGAGCTGALVAQLKGNMENCNSYSNTIVCENGYVIGGIVGKGYAGSKISNCNNSSTITAGKYSSGASLTGGIVGNMLGTSILNCTNSGAVYATGNNVGGIAGQTDITTIEMCTNTGDVTIEGSYAGGIVGVAHGRVFSCTNTAAITAKTDWAGGITAWTNSDVDNCTNTGNISTSGSHKGEIYAYKQTS